MHRREALLSPPPIPIEDVVEKRLKLGIEFDDTHRLFDVPHIGRGLTEDEAWQIAENVTGFFALLAEWSQAEISVPSNDTGKASASDREEVRRKR